MSHKSTSRQCLASQLRHRQLTRLHAYVATRTLYCAAQQIRDVTGRAQFSRPSPSTPQQTTRTRIQSILGHCTSRSTLYISQRHQMFSFGAAFLGAPPADGYASPQQLIPDTFSALFISHQYPYQRLVLQGLYKSCRGGRDLVLTGARRARLCLALPPPGSIDAVSRMLQYVGDARRAGPADTAQPQRPPSAAQTPDHYSPQRSRHGAVSPREHPRHARWMYS